MKHLYFVRHGLTLMNMSGHFSGRTDTPLHKIGRDQATQTGQGLKDVTIDLIVASPMDRARETAELIADQIGYDKDKIITNELFTERDFGPLEGETYHPNLGDVEGVEAIKDIITRAAEGLEFLRSRPEENILLVSHGAIGRALRHNVDPSIPFSPSKGFENAEVVQLL